MDFRSLFNWSRFNDVLNRRIRRTQQHFGHHNINRRTHSRNGIWLQNEKEYA